MNKKLFLFFWLFLPWILQSGPDQNTSFPPPFGKMWSQIKRLENEELLYSMITKRRDEIATIKDHWKEKIPTFEEASFQDSLQVLLKKGTLSPSEHGSGGAYYLYDETETPRFVIKPFDEDILCLNNRKSLASPYNNQAFRVRDYIPLYRTAQAEMLSYSTASLLGFNNLTPPTHLSIITHPTFFDVTDQLDTPSSLKEKMAPADREKLCTVHTYLPNLQNLYQLVEEWLDKNLSEQEISAMMDLEDFENLVIFIWLLFDTDAHAGNLYVKKDEKGMYHLVKIDNGLTFPNRNSHLLNALYFFPQAKQPLSERACDLIQTLPIEKIIEKFHFFEMEPALDAFHERVEILQQLVKNPHRTIQEIDTRLHALESIK